MDTTATITDTMCIMNTMNIMGTTDMMEKNIVLIINENHFFFFSSSNFSDFFLFINASKSSNVWAPGIILEGGATGEFFLLVLSTASSTLFITLSRPENSSCLIGCCVWVPRKSVTSSGASSLALSD